LKVRYRELGGGPNGRPGVPRQDLRHQQRRPEVSSSGGGQAVSRRPGRRVGHRQNPGRRSRDRDGNRQVLRSVRRPAGSRAANDLVSTARRLWFTTSARRASATQTAARRRLVREGRRLVDPRGDLPAGADERDRALARRAVRFCTSWRRRPRLLGLQLRLPPPRASRSIQSAKRPDRGEKGRVRGGLGPGLGPYQPALSPDRCRRRGGATSEWRSHKRPRSATFWADGRRVDQYRPARHDGHQTYASGGRDMRNGVAKLRRWRPGSSRSSGRGRLPLR